MASMNELTSFKSGSVEYVVARSKHKRCFLDEIERFLDCITLENTIIQFLTMASS